MLYTYGILILIYHLYLLLEEGIASRLGFNVLALINIKSEFSRVDDASSSATHAILSSPLGEVRRRRRC